MITYAILVLILFGADGKPVVATQVMPSPEACAAAVQIIGHDYSAKHPGAPFEAGCIILEPQRTAEK